MSELFWYVDFYSPGMLPSCSSMLLEADASDLWPSVVQAAAVEELETLFAPWVTYHK